MKKSGASNDVVGRNSPSRLSSGSSTRPAAKAPTMAVRPTASAAHDSGNPRSSAAPSQPTRFRTREPPRPNLPSRHGQDPGTAVRTWNDGTTKHDPHPRFAPVLSTPRPHHRTANSSP